MDSANSAAEDCISIAQILRAKRVSFNKELEKRVAEEVEAWQMVERYT